MQHVFSCSVILLTVYVLHLLYSSFGAYLYLKENEEILPKYKTSTISITGKELLFHCVFSLIDTDSLWKSLSISLTKALLFCTTYDSVIFCEGIYI